MRKRSGIQGQSASAVASARPQQRCAARGIRLLLCGVEQRGEARVAIAAVIVAAVGTQEVEEIAGIAEIGEPARDAEIIAALPEVGGVDRRIHRHDVDVHPDLAQHRLEHGGDAAVVGLIERFEGECEVMILAIARLIHQPVRLGETRGG